MCSVGTICCSQCPNYSTKSQNDLNYHIVKKHGAPKPAVAHICMICKDKLTGFYALRQHKSQAHGQNCFKTNGDSTPFLDDIDNESLEEELRACQHFLVDSQLEKGLRRVSILHWILLVLKKSTQSWIMSFNSSNVLQKFIWLLALC